MALEGIRGFVVLCAMAICFKTAVSVKEGETTECFTIGVIAHGNHSTNTTSKERFGSRIKLIWTFINTDEIYYIFRAVRSFDARDDVDVIMLLDYDPSILRMPQLLVTKSKDIVIWGDTTEKIESRIDASVSVGLTNAEICGGEVDPTLDVGDPYCKTDLQSTGDSNFPYESMTVTAPYALAELIETLRWKSVFVIHENATVRETRLLIDTLSQKKVFLVIFNMDTTDDFHDTLRRIYDQTVPFEPQLNFVVLCRFHCARKVFRAANQFDVIERQKTLMKKFSRWLVTVYGHSKGVSRALQACADDLDNVAIVAIPEFSGAGSSHLEGVVEEMLRDLYIDQSRNETEIPDIKRYMTDLLKQKAATPTSKCKGYNIDTLLWHDSGRGFSSVGHVDVAGNVVLKAKLFPNTAFGYNKRQFLVATLETLIRGLFKDSSDLGVNCLLSSLYFGYTKRQFLEATPEERYENIVRNEIGHSFKYGPFVKKTIYQNGTAAYEGSVMDLLNELAHDLNFTYKIIEPEDQMWGSLRDENSLTFNGMVGQLQREEVDIVAAPLSIYSSRVDVVDFSYPFYYEYTTVVTKKPDPQATKWRTFVDLFRWKVLLAIGVSLAVVTVLIFLLEKYNPFYDIPEHGEERNRNGGLHYLHNSFWYMYGTLLSQGGVHLPDSTAGRTLVSCWWLMGIVVVGIYTGNLIAFLTVAKEKAPFNTLAEMMQVTDFMWGTLGGTVWELVFMNSSIPDYKKLGEGLREFNKTDPGVLHLNASYHIERVLQGGYAWIGDKTSIQIYMARECDLIQIQEEFLPVNYGFGFQHNSPHTLKFSEQIMKIREGGLWQIWQRKWWPKTNFCSDTHMTSKPISLPDVQSAFYICLIGSFIGFVAFLTEIIIFKYRTRKADKGTDKSEKQEDDSTTAEQSGQEDGTTTAEQ